MFSVLTIRNWIINVFVTSPALSISSLPGVLYISLRPHGLSHVPFGVSIGAVPMQFMLR